MAKPSAIVKEQEKAERKEKEVEKPVEEEPMASAEFEKTLKRLVNAVFDLQKDIAKVQEEVSSVDNNIEMLRNQFQDFAEKTQQQLGVMIPAKQFKTADESRTSSLQGDLKALKKEMKSVEELRRHIEQRHTSGAMPEETYNEQVAKLEDQIETLKARIDSKEKELESLSEQS